MAGDIGLPDHARRAALRLVPVSADDTGTRRSAWAAAYACSAYDVGDGHDAQRVAAMMPGCGSAAAVADAEAVA